MKSSSKITADFLFLTVLERVIANSRFMMESGFIQHGETTCLLHSVAVAYYSYKIAKFLKCWFLDHEGLIRGALLHDYFLYDWHIPDPKNRFHGFKHPKKALKNAKKEFELTPMEEDIVKNHMFPLTPVIPKYKETLLVCTVDKICSIYEIFAENAYKGWKVCKIMSLAEKSAKHDFS